MIAALAVCIEKGANGFMSKAHVNARNVQHVTSQLLGRFHKVEGEMQQYREKSDAANRALGQEVTMVRASADSATTPTATATASKAQPTLPTPATRSVNARSMPRFGQRR